MKQRGFELLSTETDASLLPTRSTAHAAGYDLKSAKTLTIEPDTIVLVPTGIKAYMGHDEVLYLYDRSSNPKKLGLVLANSVGVIDSDYYNNESNEGHIFVQFKNISNNAVTINKGDRIAQAVFAPFLLADGDNVETLRTGGFGSTGK